MKIALLGAPGAGKTKLAKSLVRKLGKDQWRAVDGYVDRLSKRLDFPFGPIPNRFAFRYNIQVLGERWTLEDEALHAGYNTITCGTIFETLVYSAAQSMPIAHLGNEQLIFEESRIAETMMSALGLLAQINFDYDALFYLPLSSRGHDWSGVVDVQLPQVLEGQFKQAITLNGTHKEKVNRVESFVKQIAAALEPHDGGTASGSGDTGEQYELESEPLSDVPSEAK